MKTTFDRLAFPPRNAGRGFLLLTCLPLLMALFGAGCNRETGADAATKPAATAPATMSPVGSYALVSVDGMAVPCRVTHEGHPMVIQSGRFLIHDNDTCLSQMFLEGRDAAIEARATYTQAGPRLTMKWQGAGTTLGSVEGDTFTMKNEGMVLAYRRQSGRKSP